MFIDLKPGPSRNRQLGQKTKIYAGPVIKCQLSHVIMACKFFAKLNKTLLVREFFGPKLAGLWSEIGRFTVFARPP